MKGSGSGSKDVLVAVTMALVIAGGVFAAKGSSLSTVLRGEPSYASASCSGDPAAQPNHDASQYVTILAAGHPGWSQVSRSIEESGHAPRSAVFQQIATDREFASQLRTARWEIAPNEALGMAQSVDRYATALEVVLVSRGQQFHAAVAGATAASKQRSSAASALRSRIQATPSRCGYRRPCGCGDPGSLPLEPPAATTPTATALPKA
jgi:hypothetical protein